MSGPAPVAGRSRVEQMLREVVALLIGPVVAVGLALLVGAVGIVLFSGLLPAGKPFDLGLPFVAYSALSSGAISTSTFAYATPLILAGLGVALGFKGGLFNIGGRGQFLMGALGAMAVATWLGSSVPAIVQIPVALLAGLALGAAAGFIPGALKATSGAHEVVTTIMLNYILADILYWAVSGPLVPAGAPQPITINIRDSSNAFLPALPGTDVSLGFLIAVTMVPIIWVLLYRTTLGFEIRTAGANPDAARYGGMKPRRLIVLTMTLAGLLCGLAGTINMLGLDFQMTPGYDTTVGFDAITVALLGRSNPIGVFFSALLLGGMRAGSGAMQIQAGVPRELVDVLQAIILLFLVINPLRRMLGARAVRGTDMAGLETVTRTYGRESV
jgi:general nucleoside transport system permease protein